MHELFVMRTDNPQSQKLLEVHGTVFSAQGLNMYMTDFLFESTAILETPCMWKVSTLGLNLISLLNHDIFKKNCGYIPVVLMTMRTEQYSTSDYAGAPVLCNDGCVGEILAI